jgi:hypothetical protein
MIGDLASRAASREATTVEEEVTFYLSQSSGLERYKWVWRTYNGWDSKLLLLSVLEELVNVVTDDDTGLSGQNVEDTHFCDCRNDELIKEVLLMDL